MTNDFDSEIGTTSGRYGQINSNDTALPLEISDNDDDQNNQSADTAGTLSLTAKYRQEKHQA